MIRVFYDHAALFIDGIRQAIVAGTLVATAAGEIISIATVNSGESLAAGRFSDFARQDGSGFASTPECLAYLDVTCSKVLQRVPTVAGVAGEAIRAGMPVALSRGDGTLRIARADSYALSFLAGLAAADSAAAFPAEAVRSSIALDDWSAVAGSMTLAKGVRYFLALSGGLVMQPDLTPGLFCTRVGYAASPTTLIFDPSDPITL